MIIFKEIFSLQRALDLFWLLTLQSFYTNDVCFLLFFVGSDFLLAEFELLQMGKLMLGCMGVYSGCDVGKLLGWDGV